MQITRFDLRKLCRNEDEVIKYIGRFQRVSAPNIKSMIFPSATRYGKCDVFGMVNHWDLDDIVVRYKSKAKHCHPRWTSRMKMIAKEVTALNAKAKKLHANTPHNS